MRWTGAGMGAVMTAARGKGSVGDPDRSGKRSRPVRVARVGGCGQAGRTIGAEGWKATGRNRTARQVNPRESRVSPTVT